MPIELTIPGSKSITNRVLLIGALSENEIILENAVICDDTSYMIQNLKKLGVEIEQKNEEIRIKGIRGQFPKQENLIELYTGNAGTATRFLTALSTLAENEITIDGDERMKERPIAILIDGLNSLGANIKTTNNYLPLLIGPQKLQGGTITIPGNISSQFISALLMTCPLASEETTIDIEQKLYSKPYVKMTLNLLKQFNIQIENNNFKQLKIPGNQIPNSKHLIYKIESDASSASYPAAYSALHPGKNVMLKNISKDSIQGDIKFLEYLAKMGCIITEKTKNITIQGPKTLKSLGSVDFNETPDLVMTFAILSAFTEGTTTLTNIENLRLKETDRLQALKNEIKKLGVRTESGNDYIKIIGNPKLLTNPPSQKIHIQTYNDHRMAMAFGIIQDLIPNLDIKNPDCVSKSYPTFWNDLKALQRP